MQVMPRDSTGTATDGWSRDIYDYETGKIADPAACDLDLRGGWWIRCIWCAVPVCVLAMLIVCEGETEALLDSFSCRGRKYKMRDTFNTTRWLEHKRTKSHLTGAIQAGMADNPVSESQLSQRASAAHSPRVHTDTTASQESVSNGMMDTRCSSAGSTPSESGSQEVLFTVIDSLSTLVSEQQDDILELRTKLQQMQLEIAHITSAFKVVHDSQLQLSQNVCSYLSEVTSKSLQTRSLSQSSDRRHAVATKSRSVQGYDTQDTDCSTTDMSID